MHIHIWTYQTQDILGNAYAEDPYEKLRHLVQAFTDYVPRRFEHSEASVWNTEFTPFGTAWTSSMSEGKATHYVSPLLQTCLIQLSTLQKLTVYFVVPQVHADDVMPYYIFGQGRGLADQELKIIRCLSQRLNFQPLFRRTYREAKDIPTEERFAEWGWKVSHKTEPFEQHYNHRSQKIEKSRIYHVFIQYLPNPSESNEICAKDHKSDEAKAAWHEEYENRQQQLQYLNERKEEVQASIFKPARILSQENRVLRELRELRKKNARHEAVIEQMQSELDYVWDCLEAERKKALGDAYEATPRDQRRYRVPESILVHSVESEIAEESLESDEDGQDE